MYNLNKIDVDFIKFDLEYAKNFDDFKYKALLKACILVTKELNIKTIFKFVDNKEMFEELVELGVDYIQGYYIGKPKLDISEFDLKTL
jgi:EAL domain-containing protein (putative c-di-GMP-specific phosphodiesterase class I)